MGKTARDVMSRGVDCVRSSDTVYEAARKLADHDIGALPICGDDNRVTGVLTDRDIAVKVVAAGKDPAATKVAELEQRTAFTVGVNDTVEEVLRTMAEHKVRRLPVVDDDGLVGMVTQADVAENVEDTKVGSLVEAISSAR